MTIEIYALLGAILLGVFHILLTSTCSLKARGTDWAAGPRDTPGKPLTGVPGRIERASKNFQETFPFFVALILVNQAASIHSDLTIWGSLLYIAGRIFYLPAYITSIWYFRTVFWGVAMLGMGMLLVAPFLL